MGEAKRRGTYEQRKAEAIDLKKRSNRFLKELKQLRGKSATGRVPSKPEVQDFPAMTGTILENEPIDPGMQKEPVSPDRVWYDESDTFSAEQFKSVSQTAGEQDGSGE